MPENSKAKILITGGSGFIGTNLVDHFLRNGYEVLNTDIQSPRNTAHQQFWKQVDILDREKIIQTVNEFSPVILLHFAARTDLDETADLNGYAANIQGVRNIIDAVKVNPTISRVVFASSQLVCRLGYTPVDELDCCPSTLYGESKVITENIIREANLERSWLIVRPTSIWGPWFRMPYLNFFLSIARGYYVHPGGVETQKQWGFVNNSAYQIERLLMAPAELVNGKLFYLADYAPTSLREIANLIQKEIGVRSIPAIPYHLLRFAASIGDGLKRAGYQNPPLTSFRLHNIVTDEVQDLLPLQRIVGQLPCTLEEGVKITIAWMKEQRYL